MATEITSKYRYSIKGESKDNTSIKAINTSECIDSLDLVTAIEYAGEVVKRLNDADQSRNYYISSVEQADLYTDEQISEINTKLDEILDILKSK